MKKYELLRIWIKTRGIVFFLLFFLIPLFFVYFIVSLLDVLGIKINSSIIKKLTSDQLFLMSLQYIAFFILFIIVIKRYKRTINFISKENWFNIMGRAFVPAILAFGFAFFILYLIFSIFELLPEMSFFREWLNTPNYGFVVFLENMASKSPLKIMLLFFYIIVLVPITEEVLFRGFLQDSVEKIFKKSYFDIIIVALIFSLFHIFSLSNAIFAFIVGIFLSIQRKKSGSINISIWVHGIINFTGLLSGIFYQYFNQKLY
ncbi:MAG: CPBP family intramembrane metalloprotease [Spirochaetes bacterium]|nr:CPBP family intramembrane metalloprotease [Spirochaetota bacterium]